MIASLNGRFVPIDAVDSISPLDRGFLYGDGIFETMRARGGHIEFLAEHLARLYGSAADLAIPFRWEPARTVDAIRDLVRAHAGSDLSVRLTLTRGIGGRRLDTEGCGEPTVLITASEIPREDAATGEGVRLVTSPFPRNERSPLARHKTLNVLECVLARELARRGAADEALLLNTAGRVAEAAAANIFLVSGGSIATPPAEEGALPGIARAAVLRAARDCGIPAEERPIPPGDLLLGDEIFLTNSLLGLRAVSRIDGESLRAGSGPAVLATLVARFAGLASESRPIEEIPRG